MFGTDLPVWQSKGACGLTERYRANVAAWKRMGFDCDAAFRAFLSGAGGKIEIPLFCENAHKMGMPH